MYSTVVECLIPGLYTEMVPKGGRFPDGSTCYRSEVIAEREPQWPDARRAVLDELVPVVILTEPDQATWHALFCPRRAVVLGPMSPHHMSALQRRFELVADGGGVRHLRPADAEPTGDRRPDAVCGRAVPGDPQPFHTPWRSDGRIGYEDGPDIDLYARWSYRDVCRECLVSRLPAGADGPARGGGPPARGITGSPRWSAVAFWRRGGRGRRRGLGRAPDEPAAPPPGPPPT
jgi:hypothetical protein